MAAFVNSLSPATDSELLDRAEAAVIAYCGWHIAPEIPDTAVFEEYLGDVLILSTMHLVSVTSVDVDGTVADPDSYIWNERGWIRRRGCAWRGKVTVTFVHGYRYPPDAIIAVIQAAALRMKANPAGNISSQSAGPFAVSYGSGTSGSAVGPASEAAMLAPYKLGPRP